MEINLVELMQKCKDENASDLHLTVGVQPVLRIYGRMVRIGDQKLTSEDLEKCVKQSLQEAQLERLHEKGEVDGSLSIKGKARFRINVFKQRGSYAIAMRNIDSSILTISQLGLPAQVKEFTRKNNGFVLVTGPTGSGKSTTLATLIDIINHDRDCHIITLEDPIEFLHKHDKGIVNQREIGLDTQNYHNGLRAALREDPDVILIGEMRDYESIAIALTAAETGHLVFSTLHTVGAAKTIDRIIDVFPPAQQQQIRIQLSMTLQGIISQQLLPRIDGKGREVAVELMFATPAIRNLIRESKTPQISNAIITSGNQGMITMDNSLLKLYKTNKISSDDLMTYCVDYEYIKQNMNI
ncbi:MAG: type IV pilus twitching motility protein PilT [Saccharofermentanales bacterium]